MTSKISINFESSQKLEAFNSFNTQREKLLEQIFLQKLIPQDQLTNPQNGDSERKLLGLANINYNIYTFNNVEFWKFTNGEEIYLNFNSKKMENLYLFPKDCVLERINFRSPYQITVIITRTKVENSLESDDDCRSTQFTLHLSNVNSDLSANLISHTNNLKLDTNFYNKTSGLSCGWPTNFLTAKLPLKLSKILKKTDWTIVSNNSLSSSKPLKRHFSSFDSNMNRVSKPLYEYSSQPASSSQNFQNHKSNTTGQKICFHCHCKSTPMWRRGPSGPGTLCNACGVKWKNGKILKEFPLDGKDPTVTLASALPQQKSPHKSNHSTNLEYSTSNHSDNSNSPECRPNSGSSNTKTDDDCNGAARTIQTPIKKRKFIPKSNELIKEQSSSTFETLPES